MKLDQRIIHILTILQSTYPKAKIALHYSNPWELLVAVILSAQCTDIMVNSVTKRLFIKYPTLDDYIHADITEFETDIKSTGFFHAKAKNILSTARTVKSKFGGTVPHTMEDLTTLAGVARKTANIVLANAFGIVEGIAVDTHVSRITQRLRMVDIARIGGKKRMTFQTNSETQTDFIKDADPVKIERELMEVIPTSEWFHLSYRIIDHGRIVCKAQRPKCGECPLSCVCPVAR